MWKNKPPHGAPHPRHAKAADGVIANNPWRPAPNGFTLMEVLVALSILAITLIAFNYAYTTNIFISAKTEGIWKAMQYANNELARLERGPTPEVAVSQGEFPPDHPMVGYAWTREVKDEEPFPGVIVRRVTLKLTWEVGGADQFYISQIYVSP